MAFFIFRILLIPITAPAWYFIGIPLAYLKNMFLSPKNFFVYVMGFPLMIPISFLFGIRYFFSYYFDSRYGFMDFVDAQLDDTADYPSRKLGDARREQGWKYPWQN